MIAERFMDCKQTQILLAPYILGDLDNDPLRCGQLQAHLRGCPECMEMYEGFQETIGFVLEHKAEFAQAFKKAREMESRNAVPVKSVEFVEISSNSSKGLFVKISAIAACLVVGFGLFFAMNKFNKPQSDSSSVASNQQQSSVKIELISGDTTEFIATGKLITASNELKTLRINDNRQMVLNVGTELSIEPYNLGCVVKLDRGEIYTQVQHDGKSFVVETSHGWAVITGTTFNIKADSNKMDLAVIEGSVRFGSDKGVVSVEGGYQSSITEDMKPTKPVACDVIQIAKWVKIQETNATIQINQPDVYFTKMLDLPVNFIPYRDLEKIDFEVWIDEHRIWFEREFPWTKRLRKLLAQDGTEVDTIDLLIESGDLWRFEWPEYSQQRILAEDRQIVEKMASRYGVEVENLFSIKGPTQIKQVSNNEALGKWLKAIGIGEKSLTIDSIHAAIFLVNARSLVWFAVENDKIQVKDKRQVLDLLTEQVKITSNSLEISNQLLLADTNKSECSTAQFDEYIRNLKDDISIIVNLEKEIKGFQF